MLCSVARKTLMALTGLFLCVFLAVHRLGNLQFFLPESQVQTQFNWYASTLGQLPVIRAAAWLTWPSVLVHIILSAVLGLHNKASVRAHSRYARSAGLAPWYSRMTGACDTSVCLCCAWTTTVVAGYPNAVVVAVSRSLSDRQRMTANDRNLPERIFPTDTYRQVNCCAACRCHSSWFLRIATTHDVAQETATTAVCVRDARDLNDIVVCK
jgi:succinate dehydrogenase/fumarate reductase cytochrome b subunit